MLHLRSEARKENTRITKLYKTIRGTPNILDLSEIFAIHGETKYYAGRHI